jgi:ATP/maltotriose-dependent transcriptional regulator MalT/DNA-binding SARP family transcriptional activator
VDPYTSGVPAPAARELRRERLLKVLHKHGARPLILLVAPPGFGKTTLAATYARDSGGAVAWLDLQAADRDTRRLFTRLGSALEAAFGEPDCLPELRRGLSEGADSVGLARLLVRDLAQAPSGFIIVLDDFHQVDSSEDAVSAVDALIRELPEGGQVVLSSREAPALSMTRLVVDGAVFPLGAEDLRFTNEETRALRELIRAASTEDVDSETEGLSAEDAARLEAQRARRAAEQRQRDEQAEGWVMGILLGGVPGKLNIGSGSLLQTYVEREVLARLTETQQGWVEMLSVLDVFTPHAAERLLGPGNWSASLIDLTECCPFLARGQDGSYRLHGLIRETALNRLRRRPDARSAHAWTVAREIAREANDPVAVVRACEELGQIEQAVELVHRVAAEAVRTGRWPAVLRTLELLPEPVRRAHPELSLMEARTLLNTGHPDRAQEAADSALQQGGRTGDVALQIAAIVELATATFLSDMPAAEDWLSAAEHLLRTTDLPPDQRRLLEGRALGLRGICATARGNVKDAREAFLNGERLLNLLGPSRDLALIQQNYGAFCNRTGDYAQAVVALAAAASHWRLMGDRNGLATTQNILGDLHLRMGRLEDAGGELHDALDAARSIGALRMEAFALISLGQWHRANGRLREAVSQFDAGLELARQIVEREAYAEGLVLRAEVALLMEDLDLARQHLADAQTEAQRVGSSSTQASVDRAIGRLHLVDGAAAKAVNYLEAALDRGDGVWGPDQRIETLYWLGTAYLKLDRAEQATTYLEQAISVADQANLMSLLVGPAAEDDSLLKHGQDHAVNPVVLSEVERLSSTRRPWTGVGAPQLSVIVRNELPRVEARLFGSFVLHRDGKLLTNASRKVDRPGELAAILILNPRGLSPDAIIEMMFPDWERNRAAHNLQMAISTVRKMLGSKAAVRLSARNYQLNPQLELVADVREFDVALGKARGATGETLVQSLTRALELYRGPLLADAAWDWLEPARLEYRSRYVSAALQLADVLASVDRDRSDGLAEQVIAVAPETDMAYERLMENARQRRDADALRRIAKRYEQAATQFGFIANPYLTDSRQRPLR